MGERGHAHARNDVRRRRRERARRASMRYAAVHIIDGVVHNERRVRGQLGVWLVLCDTVHLCKERGHARQVYSALRLVR